MSVAPFEGQEVLKVAPEALTPRRARGLPRRRRSSTGPGTSAQLAAILDDPEASENDRGRRARAAAQRRGGGRLRAADVPGHGHRHDRGQEGPAGLDRRRRRGAPLARHLRDLREGEPALLADRPRSRCTTRPNSGTNLPAQIDLYATDGMEYHFLMIAKGGGSANKTFLFQETKALLNPASLVKFLSEKMKTLGTAACPPYHLVFVIGGTSAEACLKTVKLASAQALDGLPTTGNKQGQAFRDLELEAQLARGRAQDRDRRAVRRQVLRARRRGSSACRATGPPARSGWASPARRTATSSRRSTATASGSRSSSGTRAASSPSATAACRHEPKVAIDLNRPMTEIRAELSKHPVATAVSLDRPDRGGPRHRPREAQGAARPRRGPAAVLQGPPGLLRGAGQDARGPAVRLLRADDRRPHGLLRRPLPVAGRRRWS